MYAWYHSIHSLDLSTGSSHSLYNLFTLESKQLESLRQKAKHLASRKKLREGITINSTQPCMYYIVWCAANLNAKILLPRNQIESQDYSACSSKCLNM